jgi:hypothetical protein
MKYQIAVRKNKVKLGLLCPICYAEKKHSKSFVNDYALKRHMLDKHGEKPKDKEVLVYG